MHNLLRICLFLSYQINHLMATNHSENSFHNHAQGIFILFPSFNVYLKERRMMIFALMWIIKQKSDYFFVFIDFSH